MLPNPWLVLATTLAFVASVGGAYSYGHHAGAEAERVEWELAIKDQQQMAGTLLSQAKDKLIQTERKNAAETLRLQNLLTSKKKDLANANAVADAAVARAGGLRDPGVAGCGAGGGDATAGSGSAGGAACGIPAGLLSPALSADLRDLVRRADELNIAYQTCLDDRARRLAPAQ